MVKQVVIKNKKYTYTTQSDLARKLGITQQAVSKLLKNNTRYIVDKKGNFGKFTLTNPVLLQDFTIKRTNTKQLIEARNYKIKNSIISNELPTNKKLKFLIKFKVYDEYLIQQERVLKPLSVVSTIDDLNLNAQNALFKFYDTIDPTFALNRGHDTIKFSYTIFSKFTKSEFNIVDTKLRDVKPLRLYYQNIDQTKYMDCVRDYLISHWKRISKNTIKALGDSNGVSTREIYDFCKLHEIRMIAYDNNENVIYQHKPPKKNTNHASLYFISHNNHLYPIKNKYLDKLKPTVNKIEIVKDADIKLKQVIDQGDEPINIITTTKDSKNKFIKCFDYNGTTYLENNEFEKCRTILKSFGIEDTITKHTNLNNITSQIQELYCYDVNDKEIHINSFFPQCDKFIKGGYGYTTERTICEDEYNNVKTIDKNKCYSYSLSQLPYLISVDIRKHKIIKYNKDNQPKKLIEHYLYIVDVEQSTILLPTNNIYSGEHLNYCKNEGLTFTIKESIQTEKHTNFYKNMIEDIYKKCKPEDAKFMINVMIGKFESADQLRNNLYVDRICNKEESKCIDGYVKRIYKTDYYIVLKEKESINLFNKKPVSIQIKDYSRIIIYEKIKELKINPDDILKIKTDSITFFDTNQIADDLDYGLDLKDWKVEQPKLDTNKFEIFNYYDLSFDLEAIYNNQKTELYNCYAGAGKTYHIINKLIPNMNDYIVLTPSHSTLKEYKINKLNSSVIQKYSFNQSIPSEQNIIIDEVGLCDRSAFNIIHKMILKGKNIYAFGDFKQLKPVLDEPYNNMIYHNAIFEKHIDLTTNHRNHFTREYYDNIINGKLNNIKEISKINSKNATDADIIICVSNKNVDKYNDLILKQKGYNSMFETGVKLVCKSNKFRNKNIYNNFEFTITNIDDNNITLDDEHEFTKEEIKQNFKLGYARTAYGVQGKSYKSLYFVEEDMKILKYDNRLTYTIISRIKTK